MPPRRWRRASGGSASAPRARDLRDGGANAAVCSHQCRLQVAEAAATKLGLLWNAAETRVKCRNEFHRNADVIRPLVSQESFRRKRWRKGMCLTVHTGNQKSASTSWNRGQDSRGIEVLPFLCLSYDRRFPTFFLCLPREPKRA